MEHHDRQHGAARAAPRHRTTLAAALAALAAGLALAGCHWPSAAERAAAPILAKNEAARGGLARWRAVRSMTLTGQLDAGRPRDQARLAASYLRQARQGKGDGRHAAAPAKAPEADKVVQLPFRMELMRPGKSRLEVTFQGQAAVQAWDGQAGLKLRPFLGRREVEPFTAEEQELARQQTDLDGPLLDHGAKGLRVALLGDDLVEGRSAWKLEVTDAAGRVRHVWVDQETALEVRTDGSRRVDGKVRKLWTTFRDWRSVDGLMVPHLLETAVEGIRGTERIVVEQVLLNPTLPATRFTSVT